MPDIPIRFIYPKKIDEKIFHIESVDNHWQEFINGQQVWILQTYCLLKKHLSNITLGNEPEQDAINIIHAGNFGKSGRIAGCYVVSLRADYRSVLWANYEVVQNKSQEKRKTKYITHWPQPGLIKRSRKTSHIKNIAFLGAAEQNILRFFHIEQDLRSMGLHYISRDREKWNDFSNIDLLLAVRQFGASDNSDTKPPTKLINAWWAEAPLIAGNDSAFSAIAEPGQDYITVNSYDDLLQKIAFLQNNPDYYQRIIQNGIIKRERFSRDRIISEWIGLFEKNIFPDFIEWKSINGIRRFLHNTSRKTIRQLQRVMLKIQKNPHGQFHL